MVSVVTVETSQQEVTQLCLGRKEQEIRPMPTIHVLGLHYTSFNAAPNIYLYI